MLIEGVTFVQLTQITSVIAKKSNIFKSED